MSGAASRGQTAVALGLLVSLPLVIVAIAFHASAGRRDEATTRAARVAVVKRMPSADFAFAGGSRHLRFLSLEEPQAAFADGPCLPDPDPAGGLAGAPKAMFADTPTFGPRDTTTPTTTTTKRGTP